MTTTTAARQALSLLSALLLAACSTRHITDSETQPLGSEVLSPAARHAAQHQPVDFVQHIQPVLEAKCIPCHNRLALPAHLSLESRAEALRTGALGRYIIPHHPEQSLLLLNVKTHHHASRMPAVGQRLTSTEVRILEKWIQEGAPWPAKTTAL